MRKGNRWCASTAGLVLGGVITGLLAIGPPAASGAVFVKNTWPLTPSSALPGGAPRTQIEVCIVGGSTAQESPGDRLPDGMPQALRDFIVNGGGVVADENPSDNAWIDALRRGLERTWESFTSVDFVGFQGCLAEGPATKHVIGLFFGESPPGYEGCDNCADLGFGERGNFSNLDANVRILPWGRGNSLGKKCLSFRPTELLDLEEYENPLNYPDMDPENLDWRWRYDLGCAAQYGMHEFGHVIGLAHEMQHPKVPDNCLSGDEGRVALTDYSVTWPIPSGKNYYVPNDTAYDGSSIMMYDDNDCANKDTVGLRFGSPEPTQADLHAATKVYPPVVDVGVLAPAGGCPETREALGVSFPGAADQSGWTGQSSSGPPVDLRFCRVDGNQLPALTSTTGSRQYSVLRLERQCPAAARPTSVILDLPDDVHTRVVTSGHIGDSGPVRDFGAIYDDVRLELCTFLPAPAGGAAALPDLGMAYGVFAQSDLVGTSASGFVHIVRPDGTIGGRNSLQCLGCDGPQSATLLNYLGVTGEEATLHIARVLSALPDIDYTLRGTVGKDGWYRSDVMLEWSWSNGDVVNGCADTRVEQDTAGTSFVCEVVNETGQSTIVAVVKRDTIVPSPRFEENTPAATNGWNNGPVTSRFSCTDGLSGVDPGASSLSVVTGAEAADQQVFGRCQDHAGNFSSARSDAFSIDLTAPKIDYVGAAPAPVNGWNTTDVTVSFSCNDPLSQVADSDLVHVLTGEGRDLDATATCTDTAGNRAQLSAGDVDIDRTPPKIDYKGASPGPNAAGWNNSEVTLRWECTDPGAGASGINSVLSTTSIVLREDGRDLDGAGICRDVAGHRVSQRDGSVDLDTLDPEISFVSRLPEANSFGWNNTDVTVKWSCAETGGTDASGIDAAASVTEVVVSQQTETGAAQGRCVDAAGNDDTDTRSPIRIDKVEPEATFDGQRPEGNDFGWVREDVVLTWTCFDEGPVQSGIDSAGSVQQVTISTDGEHQQGSAHCVDQAGNDRDVPGGDVNIDRVPPDVDIDVPRDGATYLLEHEVPADFTCTDPLSKIRTCDGTVAAGTPIDTATVGTKSFAVAAADHAGNSADATSGYRVVYDFRGFFTTGLNPLLGRGIEGLPIRLDFTIDGFRGFGFLSAAARSQRVDCGTLAPVSGTVPAGGAERLSFDPDSGRYSFDWATRLSWGGTCRVFSLPLDDGTVRRALVRFGLLRLTATVSNLHLEVGV